MIPDQYSQRIKEIERQVDGHFLAYQPERASMIWLLDQLKAKDKMLAEAVECIRRQCGCCEVPDCEYKERSFNFLSRLNEFEQVEREKGEPERLTSLVSFED